LGAYTCITARGLAKKYDGSWGVVDASFTAPGGAVTVLVGPNGAGKTTTVGMLSTVLRPSRGDAWVEGLHVVRDAWRLRRRIALVPQEARIDPNWTPWEAVRWYLVARGWGLREAAAAARRALEELGLWEARNRPGWVLSGGQRRRVVAAMALASEASVVFLDEPTTGLDVEARYRVWELVRREASRGRCIVFTTHDMREAGVLADHAVLMHRGRVVAEGPPAALASRLPYRYRVVLTGARRVPDAARLLRLGESTVIAYAGTRREALRVAAEAEAEKIVVEETSFEDVYLIHVHGAGER